MAAPAFMYLCRRAVVLPLFFWVLPRGNLHSLKISYVGAIVFQKVLSRRQSFYGSTMNYCRFFIQNYEISWGWLFFVVKWMKYQYFHFGVFHLLMICSPFRLFDFLMLRTSRFFIFWDSLSSNFGPSRLPCGSLGSHLPHHWHAFYAFGIYLPYPFEGGGGPSKQTNKQSSKQANKQTNKHTSK